MSGIWSGWVSDETDDGTWRPVCESQDAGVAQGRALAACLGESEIAVLIDGLHPLDHETHIEPVLTVGETAWWPDPPPSKFQRPAA